MNSKSTRTTITINCLILVQKLKDTIAFEELTLDLISDGITINKFNLRLHCNSRALLRIFEKSRVVYDNDCFIIRYPQIYYNILIIFLVLCINYMHNISISTCHRYISHDYEAQKVAIFICEDEEYDFNAAARWYTLPCLRFSVGSFSFFRIVRNLFY
uniref:Uncharacterized protein n=1 Tax=Onchocerca volvulus TaxID=6282 RepID=A0A8R1XXT6_ONCVO